MGLDYGLIGNGQTAALISKDGSIDWCCMPDFDSPSVFAKLLDVQKGGSFSIQPVGKYTTTQTYLRNTNVLETIFETKTGSFKVTDFMPCYPTGTDSQLHAPCQIHRLIEVLSGKPEVAIQFEPRLDYARTETALKTAGTDHIVATDGKNQLFLYTKLPLEPILKQKPLVLSDSAFFILSYDKPVNNLDYSINRVHAELEWTIAYWRRWVKHCYLPAMYQDEIIRSALTLKMMVCNKTGAIIAAPTTSLPETIGEERNWDYRFCWLRDAYFVIAALSKLAQFEEKEKFLEFLKKICVCCDSIRPLYTLEGEIVPLEAKLKHLSGYQNSQPVRVGNDATTHHQTDVYGEMALAMSQFFSDRRFIREDLDELWDILAHLVTLSIEHFPKKDNGLWEFRNDARHYTFSKLMCWVAVDRGYRIAQQLGKTDVLTQWSETRDQMREEILEKAWNQKAHAYTQAYGSEDLDASTLLMPVFGITEADDIGVRATILATEERLMKDGLVFRYTNQDDFGKPQNAFLLCTFWLIDALILIGEKDKARRHFERVMQLGNHLGLFSEHVNPDTGELTGNFPQAYTHVAIINTAMLLASCCAMECSCVHEV